MIDRLLDKLPNSTTGWTCPWFWSISWFALMSALCALVEPSTATIAAAAAGGAVFLYALIERQAETPTCSPQRRQT